MILATASYDEVAPFLYRDPFANADLLATLEGPAAPALAHVCRDRQLEGVLVVTRLREGERDVALEATSPEVAAALLRTLPIDEPFRFTLHRPWMAPVLGAVCRVEHEATMASFRCEPETFRRAPGGRELKREDTAAVRRSHDETFINSFRDALRGRLTRDRLRLHAFGAFDGPRLIARCLTTWGDSGIHRLLGTIWSVYTEPSARQRGFGGAAVAAATAAVLESGRIARYLSYRENTASRRLCMALGYRHHHDIQYYHGTRRPSP